jgi:hypothetical protein
MRVGEGDGARWNRALRPRGARTSRVVVAVADMMR